jgi:hypothetical protein
MKRVMWVIAAATMLGAAAWAQDEAHRDRPAAPSAPEMDPFRQLELQNRQLELRAHENKIRAEREMLELKLQQRRAEFERQRTGVQERTGWACGAMPRCPVHDRIGILGPLFGLCLVIHVLLAVWVYQDIRRRNAGSGIWIVITLLTGICGALLYALVRLGDNKSA